MWQIGINFHEIQTQFHTKSGVCSVAKPSFRHATNSSQHLISTPENIPRFTSLVGAPSMNVCNTMNEKLQITRVIEVAMPQENFIDNGSHEFGKKSLSDDFDYL